MHDTTIDPARNGAGSHSPPALDVEAELAFAAAVSAWFLDADEALIARCVADRKAFDAPTAGMLSRIAPHLGQGFTCGDVLQRLQLEQGGALAAARIEGMLGSASAVSVLHFEQTFARLQARRAGHLLADVAADAEAGVYASPLELFAELDRLRESAPVAAEEWQVHTLGNPEKAPDWPAPEWLIEDMLQPGYVVAHGKRKQSMKTLFFLACAFALQTGRELFGRTVKQKRCLWVQRDTPGYTFSDYGRRVQQGMQFAVCDLPFVVDRLDLLRAEDQARLSNLVRRLGVEVLFLDAARAVSRVEEKDSGEVAKLVRDYLCGVLRDELKATVILIAHPAKSGGSVRGSNDWENAADSILRFTPVMRNEDQQDERPLFVSVYVEGRHEEQRLAFKLDQEADDGPGMVVRELSEEEQDQMREANQTDGRKRKEPPENRILAWLAENPGRHSLGAIQRGTRLRREDTKSALLNLQGRGLMDYVPGARNANLWGLTESGLRMATRSRDQFPVPPTGGNGNAEPVREHGPPVPVPTGSRNAERVRGRDREGQSQPGPVPEDQG